MSITVTPNQAQIQTTLRAFLISILPQSVSVIRGQVNRVPEPEGTDFVVVTEMRRERIETTINAYADNLFVGSIAGGTLTIARVIRGTVGLGNAVFGIGVIAGTTISSFGTGTGVVGTYGVSPAVQSVASTLIAVGVASYKQPTKITYQIDVYGPGSADNAATISTLFRDNFATEFFKGTGFDVSPLYADDPRQVPFMDAEQQVETRYMIDAVLQVNQVVSGLPVQFADVLSIRSVPAV